MNVLLENLRNHPTIKAALRLLSYEYNSWKLAYRDLIKQMPQNKSFDVEKFLLDIQPNIKFDMEEYER